MDEKLRTILAELRQELEALYGNRLVKLVLFGSQARGDAEPESDIDVLVVLKGPVKPGEEISRTSLMLSDLSLKFGEVVSCIYMDSDRFTHRNGPLLRNVRKEGIGL